MPRAAAKPHMKGRLGHEWREYALITFTLFIAFVFAILNVTNDNVLAALVIGWLVAIIALRAYGRERSHS